MECHFRTPQYVAEPKKLFSAKSYFIDRFTPAVEEIVLPGYTLPTGTMTASLQKEFVTFSRQISRKRKLVMSLVNAASPIDIADKTIIDFRRDSPSNWSHALNFHIPFAYYLEDNFSSVLKNKQSLYLLPGNTPKYIQNLFSLFELEVKYTDQPVRGDCIDFEISPFDCLRSIARRWIEEYLARTDAYIKIQRETKFSNSNFFFSRKDTRKIINEDEVADFLFSSKEYEKVYAEDFSAEEQISIFMHAPKIAAIHGAAIGPLLYRPSEGKKLELIEIFSPGHMTNFYRATCDQVGAKWAGVRGRIEPKQIKGAYDFNRAYLEYSLSDFYVDIESLELAINFLSEI